MPNEIINRVANSKLVTIDLEDYYPEGTRTIVDIKKWLFEGIVLREKPFRQAVKDHDWSQYQNHYVAITCSTDAIVPTWAFMLVALQLQPYVKHSVLGTLNDLETALYQTTINQQDFSYLNNKPVIIKGCGKKPVPKNAYIILTTTIKPLAKSISFGEACSSVPLYKRN